jgi:hypothetical protein
MRRALALALLAAACGGGPELTPSDVTGAWAYADPLPASALYEVTSDSLLFFDREGTGPWRGMRRTTFRDAGTPPGEHVLVNSHFEFRVADDAVRLVFDCPPDAPCEISPLRATVDGEMLTLHQPPISSVSPQRYRRVTRHRAETW